VRSLSLDETEKHFKLGIEKAREFFSIPSEVETILIFESPVNNADASVEWQPSILKALIRLDTNHLMKQPHRIWSAAGHEVAHLVGREILAVYNSNISDNETVPKQMAFDLLEAIEMQTTRLERMFLKAVPDPLEELYGKA